MIRMVEQTKLQPVAPAQGWKADERGVPLLRSGCAEGLNLKDVYLSSFRRTRTLQSNVYLKLMCFLWQFLLNYLSTHFDGDEPRNMISRGCFLKIKINHCIFEKLNYDRNALAAYLPVNSVQCDVVMAECSDTHMEPVSRCLC